MSKTPNSIEIKNRFQPLDSQKMWDSLTLESYMSRPDYYTITALVQKSIRFEPYKKLAVYDGKHYLGNYEIHSKTEMSYTEISNKTCVMLFGKTKKDSFTELQNTIKKGKFTENSKYYFIILFKVGENKAHEIKSKH
jgi:hypothetical protein